MTRPIKELVKKKTDMGGGRQRLCKKMKQEKKDGDGSREADRRLACESVGNDDDTTHKQTNQTLVTPTSTST